MTRSNQQALGDTLQIARRFRLSTYDDELKKALIRAAGKLA